MYKIRKSEERGATNLGWLDSKHSFSFGDYFDPENVNFKSLRVINDDLIGPDKGFGMHPHRDMEIISFVFDGALEHKDSLGNGSRIEAGNIQYMSAGSGIMHSEFNPSGTDTAHLLQVWIRPDKSGYEPRYGQISLNRDDKLNKWLHAISGEGGAGQIKIRQDADISVSVLEAGAELSYDLSKERSFWLQVVSGSVDINGNVLSSGDAISGAEIDQLKIKSIEESELLLFDLGSRN